MREIKKIAIYGAGLMGKGLATYFALKGFSVIIYTRNLGNEKIIGDSILNNLKILSSFDLIKENQIQPILDNVILTDSFERAARSADLIIENVLENLDIKRNYFERLDKICDEDVVLASNTSSIRIAEIGQNCIHKERIIGMHFWNPAYITPLVEVIKTIHASDEMVQNICNILEKNGKKPIVVKKDVPGFLANRMQNALNREAYYIVGEGIADAKDVDDSIKYGFGMRMPFQGPLEKADMIGIDIPYAVQKYLLKDLYNGIEPPAILKQKIDENCLGFKTGGHGFYERSEQEIAREKEEFVKNLIMISKALGRI